MFTGIVTDVGTVRSAEQRGDLRLVIATSYDTAGIDLGASIACSGVCLTVVDKGDDWFAVDISAETISKTAADRWREGARLNLERALRLGDELGGHIVTGHVDAVAEVLGTCPEGDSTRVRSACPACAGADDRREGLDHARWCVAYCQRSARGRRTGARISRSTSSPIRRSTRPWAASGRGNSSMSRSTYWRGIWNECWLPAHIRNRFVPAVHHIMM